MPADNEVERRVEMVRALTLLQADVKQCALNITENTILTNKVLKVLHGDGGVGLVTKTTLNTQSLGRLWKWVAFLSSVIIAGAVGIIWKSF